MIVIGFINRHRKGLRSAAAVTVMAAMLVLLQPSSAPAIAETEKAKSETVYAVLGNDGSYSGATVVNCFTRGGEIVDYGEYTRVKNLMGPGSPVIEGSKITWPAEAAGTGAFYYEGETQKPLPISINIKYWLNGKETAPEDIAGKTGELKIEFTLKNETGTGEMDEAMEREVLTPLAASVSIKLDNAMYSVLDVPENGSSVLAGSSYTLSYASFPLPEDTFSFTVFGKDMALEPINIVVLPKSPPGIDSYGDFIDVDGISEGADDMISGADDMQTGVGDLLSALDDLKYAVKKLRDGIGDLKEGAKTLAGGADDLYDNVQILKSKAHGFYSGFSEFASKFALLDAGIGELNTNVSTMAASVSALSANSAMLDSGIGDVGSGLSGISSSNADLRDSANDIAAAYPEDAIEKLAEGLQSQQSAISGLVSANSALRALSSGIKNGAADLNTAFAAQLVPTVQNLYMSSGQLYDGCLDLLDGAEAIDAACAQLSNAVKKLAGGAGDISDGTSEIADKLPELLSGIDDMIEGVEDLKDGISKLNNDGLHELKDTVTGLDGYLNKLSAKANAYGSFMDARNSAYSTVQFILKTKGIGTEE